MAIIKKKKLSEKVVEEIKSRIKSGMLTIGEKLPNQNELAKELGVSRTSLREAINILDLLGVIEQRPGYGTVITKLIPEIENVKPDLLIDKKTTIELLEARLIIESGIAFLAAKNATPQNIQKLKELVESMQRQLDEGDHQKYFQLDLMFHQQIVKASNNKFIKESFGNLEHHMERFMKEHTILRFHLLERIQNQHLLICKAISDHNQKVAVTTMEKHIKFLLEHFQKNNIENW